MDLPVSLHSAKVNTVLCELYSSEILSPISGTIVEKRGKSVENLWNLPGTADRLWNDEPKARSGVSFHLLATDLLVVIRWCPLFLFFFSADVDTGGRWETS